MKKTFKFIKVMNFFILFNIAIYCNCIAVPAYYTDNDYESSSVYANVGDRKETINQIPTSKINAGNNTKKIYNTIIIRNKKSENTKAEKQVSQQIKQEPQVIPQVPQVQPVQQIKKEQTIEKKKDKTTILGKIYKQISSKITNPFYQTKNDSWYIYGLVSYGVSSKSTLDLTVIENNGEINGSNSIRNTISSKTNWEGSGFGAIVGLKTYFSKTLVSVFLGPEAFYSSLNLNQNSVLYNTKQYTFALGTYTGEGYVNYGDNYILPVEFSMKPQDIFGGTIRIGLTICNTISLFAKANIGGLRSNVFLRPRDDLIDWNSMFTATTNQDLRNQIRAQILADINDRINTDTNAERSVYIRSEQYKNKLSLTYGFGAGIEASLWNQHLILRIDYDHYWTTGSIDVSGTKYPRITAQNAVVSATNKGIDTVDDGAKWRMKTNFGMFKFSVGISF